VSLAIGLDVLIGGDYNGNNFGTQGRCPSGLEEPHARAHSSPRARIRRNPGFTVCPYSIGFPLVPKESMTYANWHDSVMH
jgi:hypothetical protein